MSKSTPLIFFGTEDYSGLVLTQLVEAGYNVVAVVTKPDHKSGRGQQTTPPAIKQIAEKNHVAVWQPNSLDDIRDDIIDSKCDWAVLVAYGKIIPKRILKLFSGGIINVHPSLLPLHRGPSPVESSILVGDTKTGVSVMKLTAEMDAGPLYLQQPVEMNGTESKVNLYNQLFTLGGQLLVENLGRIVSGDIQPKEQNEAQATYSKMIRKEDGKLDFVNKTADELDKEIRAYLGWPKSYTKLGSVDVAITSAIVVPSNHKPGLVGVVDDEDAIALFIYCKEGSLDVDSLQPAGKKDMKIRAFISGYKNQLPKT